MPEGKINLKEFYPHKQMVRDGAKYMYLDTAQYKTN
jgi:hypothetical protein